jgi:uncharacterized membrane protein YeaQ/YmgE (transglycosylase-associated protein family)
MELIIGLLSGAAGGNVAGKLMGSLNQGTLINSISGIVGGGLGGTILSALGAGGGEGMDIAGIVSQVAGGGIGGGVVLAVVGAVRNMIGK